MGELFSNSRAKGNDSLPIYSVSQSRGLVPRDSLDRNIQKDAKSSDNLKAKPNDLVYNMMRMWQGAVGLATTDCMISPAYVVLSPKKSVDSVFFMTLFEKSRSRYLFTSYSHGLTLDRLRLYYRDFSSIKIKAPTLTEQQKITAFLTTIDQRLQLLKKKKTQLEAYKKGVTQKLFTQEVRFKDENEEDFPDWEYKRLGEICKKESSTISANSIDNLEGKYKVYGASGHLQNIDYYQHEESYISIVKDGAGVGRVMICDAYSSVLGTLDVIKPMNNNDLHFLLNLINQIRFTKYITGSTIPHIYFKDYSKEKVEVPSLSEQQKIAAFLTSLDERIGQVAGQIESTSLYKKGLLQKMFI